MYIYLSMACAYDRPKYNFYGGESMIIISIFIVHVLACGHTI